MADSKGLFCYLIFFFVCFLFSLKGDKKAPRNFLECYRLNFFENSGYSEVYSSSCF